MLSKIVQRTTFSPWSESLTLPFIRFIVKQNAVEILWNFALSRGITAILVRPWEVAGLEVVVNGIVPSLPLPSGKWRPREGKK
jgi:hypothetical protein